MRVTFLTTQLDLVKGGGSNFDRDQRARGLMDLGHTVKIITAFSQNNSLAGPLPYTILQERLHPKQLSLLQFHRAVADILRKYESETDVYYIDGHVFCFGAGLYKNSGHAKIIAHFENYGFPTGLVRVPFRKRAEYFLRFCLERFVLSHWENKVDLITFSSPVAAHIYKGRGLDKRKFAILPNVFDASFFAKTPPPFACTNSAKFHVLCTGRVIREKGVEVLVRAAPFLKDLEIGIDIVGEGPEKERLMRLADDLGVAAMVHWHHRVERDQLSSLLHHADAFVFPVIWTETFGLAAIEAMACGVPTIVASDTGTAWAAGDGALIFKRGDSEDLARKIRLLYKDRDLLNSIAEKGRQQVTQYDYRIVSRLLDSYVRTCLRTS